MKVNIDDTTCIGCGTCVVLGPQVFELDKSGKTAVRTGVDLNDKDKLLSLAKSCPVSAIIVSDENGKQIYPVIK